MPDNALPGDPELTVVVPTHNGGARVERLLAHLVNQCPLTPGVEVLVVDNRSTDSAVRDLVASPAAAALRARGWAVRVVEEPRPGESFARVRGLDEARGGVVCFLDDDVEPDGEFLKRGYSLFSDSTLGAVLPRIEPHFETPPPRSILKRQHLLAINHHVMPPEPVVWAGDCFPFAPVVTAGLFVRRSALRQAIGRRGPERLLPGRIRSNLGSGTDTEFGILLLRNGQSIRFEPTLSLRHHIGARRFRTSYFVRLIFGIVRSEATIRDIYRPDVGGLSLSRRIGGVIIGAAAAPVLCLRTDGRREALFVFASRWAQLLGPYRQLADSRRAHAQRCHP